MEKSKKKFVKKAILLGVALGICVALLLFVLIWFFGASYPAFYKNARAEAEIAGLREGISPQGLCPAPSNDKGYEFAMSGYMVDKSPSRVYLIGKQNEKYVTLKDKNGKDVKTHFGGITSAGDWLWVASGKKLLRVRFGDVLAAENGGAVTVYDELTTGLQNAFCYCADGKLYAGEFYRAGNYETPTEHRITVNGETNYAFVYEYSVDLNLGGGVVNNAPEKVISVRGLVQGIAVYAGGITLSTSYGLADSVLYTYENILDGEPTDTAEIDGRKVPLYRLDSTNLKSTLVAPCMSEELFVKDGRVYVLFESLCDKYKYFVRVQIREILSLPIEDL